MKQRMKQFRKLLLPLLIATLLFQTQALAADYSCTISIPVEVQVTGDSAPDDVDFTVTMTPVDEANPMPDASSVTITGSGTATLAPSPIPSPGTTSTPSPRKRAAKHTLPTTPPAIRSPSG